MTTTTTCTACGKELAAGTKFCSGCGAPGPITSPEVPIATAQPASQHVSASHPSGLPIQLSASIGPALAMVASAAALAFGLPSAIVALGTDGSNGTKTVLVLLLALTTAEAIVGTVFASIRLKQHGEDPVLGRLVYGFGLFASVYAGLQFIAALAN